jgi:predicted nucleotide-binding protein (sugar kinase/HSP70/actin superfamily)
MEERLNSQPVKPKPRIDIRLPFSKEMRKTHTIIAPQMAPIHFELVQEAFAKSGYNFEVLPTVSNADVEVGLKFVNNDACYPSIIVIGQLINAVKSGNYDPETTAMLITQTGGGCRATNYIGFLKKGLEDAGFGKMPVISLNALGMDDNPGFKITLSLMYRSMMSLVYGDLMMRLVLRTRPNEKTPGATEKLYEYWMDKLKNDLNKPKFMQYSGNLKAMVKDFAEVEITDKKKPRVGLVGEILVKFHPAANNDIIRIIEDEGAEAVVPDLIDFFLYSSYNNKFKYTHLSGSLKGWRRSRTVISVLEFFRRPMVKALSRYPRFGHPERIETLAKKTKPVVSLGTQMGEGWFLTGEMIELIESGVPNVVCMQPFACLPNQVTGKGMIKALKDRYPESNIAAIDYDPGTSEVNQLNRIKLMLNVAFRSMGITQNLTAPDILDVNAEKKKIVIPI